MPCLYSTPSREPLDFERYERLHPDGRHLIRLWYERALDEGFGRGSYFEAFIFLWIAFNGFATCVTDRERDAEIVRTVAKCPSLRGRFVDAVAKNAELSRAVDEFATYWPIFKVQDLRRLNLLHASYVNRQAAVQARLAVAGTSHEPSCYRFHEERGSPTPKDWPHVLHAIYRVRCNLFHGEKSPASDIDHLIVRLAFRVLATFLSHTRLLM